MATLAALALATSASPQGPLGTAFTYQGRLTDAGAPANGTFDFEFKLFTAPSGGTQVGATVTATGVPVSAGLFVRQLDFGAGAFVGTARFLEVGVKAPAAGSYTLLGARQELTPAPNAVFAAKAGDATTVGGLTCTTGQVAKWSGSAWSCGSDVDTNSGGTVTSIATGAGLTGGTITGSGTVSIDAKGVIAEMIAPGQVTKSVNKVTDDITIVGSGLATVSTKDNTIIINAGTPSDCTASGTIVTGVAGDTTLIGAGYTEMGSTGLEVWKATATTGAPTARGYHTAVWTGTRMIVWGGNDGSYANTGGQYDPTGNSWTATATTVGVPTGRYYHTAVWTGSRMIVWGGYDGTSLYTGGQYDPIGNSWTATTTVGAPTERYGHAAVWTGSRMIVWGGFNNGAFPNTGGQYDPIGNSWTTTTTVGAPTGRGFHAAVWTGSRMIVWGGFDGTSVYTGGQYDPIGNSWTATTTVGAPTARTRHTAVWTGSRMIVWGGIDGVVCISTGGQYDPTGDSWTATATTVGVPTGCYLHTAVWTGSRMIVWGGNDGALVNTGGQYDPAGNSWTVTTSAGAPAGRQLHTAVWTGSRMIVWGGFDADNNRANTGGQWLSLSYYMKN